MVKLFPRFECILLQDLDFRQFSDVMNKVCNKDGGATVGLKDIVEKNVSFSISLDGSK